MRNERYYLKNFMLRKTMRRFIFNAVEKSCTFTLINVEKLKF